MLAPKSLYALAMLVAVALAPAASAAEPRDALASFHAALAAGDRPTALSLLAPDVAIYESGFVERSRDEYASHHLGDDMEFAKTSTRKVLKQTERVQGSMAILWQETETVGTSKGKPVHVLGTETALLEKQGDSWIIRHVHWSSRKKSQ
ncbi:MAG TPA: nuclear transport factor 2 family protein [Telluria sp.]|nr:nuclear transport factor 2 family protein [Telluria sp.]